LRALFGAYLLHPTAAGEGGGAATIKQ